MKKVLCSNCGKHIFNTPLDIAFGEIRKKDFILVNKNLEHSDEIKCPLCGKFFLTKDMRILTDKEII